MTTREVLDGLRRVVLGILGVGLMLLAVFRIPIAVVDRDALLSLAFLALGVFGLWLVRLSRPKASSRPVEGLFVEVSAQTPPAGPACPHCGATTVLQSPAEAKDGSREARFVCANGHEFQLFSKPKNQPPAG